MQEYIQMAGDESGLRQILWIEKRNSSGWVFRLSKETKREKVQVAEV
jgi:hypothetical protein